MRVSRVTKRPSGRRNLEAQCLSRRPWIKSSCSRLRAEFGISERIRLTMLRSISTMLVSKWIWISSRVNTYALTPQTPLTLLSLMLSRLALSLECLVSFLHDNSQLRSVAHLRLAIRAFPEPIPHEADALRLWVGEGFGSQIRVVDAVGCEFVGGEVAQHACVQSQQHMFVRTDTGEHACCAAVCLVSPFLARGHGWTKCGRHFRGGKVLVEHLADGLELPDSELLSWGQLVRNQQGVDELAEDAAEFGSDAVPDVFDESIVEACVSGAEIVSWWGAALLEVGRKGFDGFLDRAVVCEVSKGVRRGDAAEEFGELFERGVGELVDGHLGLRQGGRHYGYVM